jgi:hypothetical protein
VHSPFPQSPQNNISQVSTRAVPEIILMGRDSVCPGDGVKNVRSVPEDKLWNSPKKSHLGNMPNLHQSNMNATYPYVVEIILQDNVEKTV